MLPKRNRLRNSADLELVRRKGHVWRHPVLILIVKANVYDTSRFAFTASRRVGNAVTRNRVRRRLREIIRRHLDVIEPGWDMLFIARERTPAAAFSELEAAVLHLLTRSQLLASNTVIRNSSRQSAL